MDLWSHVPGGGWGALFRVVSQGYLAYMHLKVGLSLLPFEVFTIFAVKSKQLL